MLNKRAQIGETMVWIIATIIIIMSLIIFVFISTQVAQVKNIGASSFFEKEFDNFDRSITKTIFAYSLFDENKDMINEWIKNE